MKKYEYEILFHDNVKGKITWFFASKPHKKVGTSLIDILNKMGAKGWEANISGTLDSGSIAEVLLKKRKSG